MMALLWASPLLAVVLLLATGRVTTLIAGVVGVVLAAAVALTVAPSPLDIASAATTLVDAVWLTWLVGSVIFGGLFLHESLVLTREGETPPSDADQALRRRRLFAACFLIGPFTESATGFGVGYVIALSVIARLRVPLVPMLILGLLSQTMVPWGALAVGTTVGAVLSGLPLAELGERSALLTAPLLLMWLALFWRFSARAGLASTIAEKLDDLSWIAAAAALLLAANLIVDAQVAVVAAIGPLVALRFWRDERPSGAECASAMRTTLPYIVLSAILIAVRAVPVIHELVTTHAVLHPLADMPAYPILLHPFLWLVLVPAATAMLGGQAGAIPAAFAATASRGWRAIAATGAFLVIAQFLDAAGVAKGLAAALIAALGAAPAVMVSPVFAAIGGLLTGSTTGSNGLFMTSQAALAGAAGVLDIGWLAAVQNVTGSAFTMLSPIRVGMGCALVGRPDLEGTVYRQGWLLGVLPLLLMGLVAVLLVL